LIGIFLFFIGDLRDGTLKSVRCSHGFDAEGSALWARLPVPLIDDATAAQAQRCRNHELTLPPPDAIVRMDP